MRDKVIAIAKTWLGTPHRHQARIRQIGIDCGQFLIAVYTEAGVIADCTPDPYPYDWHLHRSEEKYLHWVQKYCNITEDNPLPGDIAVFQFGRCVSHAGIVVEWPLIIHAYVGMGVIMSDVNEAILLTENGKSRLRGIYRLKGWKGK